MCCLVHHEYVPVNVVLSLDRLFPHFAAKAKAFAELSTAAAREAYRNEVDKSGGLWTTDQVRAAFEAAPKLQSLDELWDTGRDLDVKVPEGKALHHLMDFIRRYTKLRR